jgi:hypothetical protein
MDLTTDRNYLFCTVYAKENIIDLHIEDVDGNQLTPVIRMTPMESSKKTRPCIEFGFKKEYRRIDPELEITAYRVRIADEARLRSELYP